MNFMSAQSLDNEFGKFWLMLSPVEKESLLTVARNYVQLKTEAGDIDIEQYNKIGNDTIVSTPLTWKRTPPCLKIHKPGSFPI